MAIKKFCQLGLLSTYLFCMLSANAEDNPFGQTFQITTHFHSYVGKPSWLLIVADVDTGIVTPYLFDITSTENFWVKFTFAHHYRITASELQFGPPDEIIHDFCQLRDGMLDRESLIITLSGDLTPDPHTSACHVMRFKEYSFPIAPPAEADDTSNNVGNSNDEKTSAPSAPAALAPLVSAAAPIAAALAPIVNLTK